MVDVTRTFGETIYAYLSYTKADKISALSVIHSLIFQLAMDSEDLQTAFCQSARKNFESNLEVGVDILKKLLLACVAPVYIIVDGLDETNEKTRKQIIVSLLEILESCQDTMICVSSRPESDLKTLLDAKAASIEVDKNNSGSIQRFVNSWAADWLQRQDLPAEGGAEILRLIVPLAAKSKGKCLDSKKSWRCLTHRQ